MSAPRVIIVGGTGAFGRRLVEGLVETTDAAVVIAGRTLESCTRLAAEMRATHPGRAVEGARLDRSSVRPADVAALDPAIVVDAAGPFQGADLDFARAVIASGASYIDIADARDFVGAFKTLDAQARVTGVVAIAGASSTPALSHAALDVLTAGWRRVDRVEIAISPGNRAPRGLSVVRAILSYAGRPVLVLKDRLWSQAPGWGLTVRHRMPGLGRRFLSLCETPDLDLIPARFPEAKTALFRAGLELAPLHLGLLAMSLLVRAGLVRDLAAWSGPVRWLAEKFERFGTDRGGMTVEAEGAGPDGAREIAVWSLVAEAGDGPNIPVLPALAFVRAMLAGTPPASPGAHHGAGLLKLADFDREDARFAIRTRIDRARPDAASVFERALGPGIERLPPAVRAVHDAAPQTTLAGTVDVEGASGSLARLVAWAFRFPSSRVAAPAKVTIARDGDDETWTRTFGGSSFRSRVSFGGAPGLVRERFGPANFDLAISADDNGFSLTVEGWRVFGLPLPRRFAPTSAARGFAHADGAYGFDVAIDLWPVGRLVRYRGRLEADEQKSSEIRPV